MRCQKVYTETMYTVSRFIIFVPIVILILSLYIHYTTPNKSSSNVVAVPSVQPQQSTVNSSSTQSSASKININLTGPYRCGYQDKETQVAAFIKNKKVFVEFTQKNETDYVLLNGDCGYKWEKGKTTGEKMCGVGTYISLFESFSSMPFFDLNTIFSMIGQVGPSISIAPEKLSAVADSCKKETVDESVFTIPTAIVFSDLQTITPPVAQ